MPELSCHQYNDNCYNMIPGGRGGNTSDGGKRGAATRKARGYKMPAEVKTKISQRVKGVKKTSTHKQHLSDNHRSVREYMVELEQTSEILTMTCTVPAIAKRFGIKNVQLLRRRSKRGAFLNGIRILTLLSPQKQL